MRAAALLLLAATGAAPAATVTPLAEARTRYEHVDQDGIAREATALTVRVRGGVQAAAGRLSGLVEGQGNLAAIGRYDDGVRGPARRPLVADPQNVALYRAQVRYATPRLAITAGRQRIALDDERFVGAIAFRNNGQTFDAVRAEWTPVAGVKADAAYVWRVRTIWGVDGTGARPAAVPGDTWLGNLGAATPAGMLTGFAYLVDEDAGAVQGYRLSSQTYGVRLAGSRRIAAKAVLAWHLSAARQSDYHRNPNDYRAAYYLADVALDLGGPRLGGGYEVLGADDGRALTSVQAPLGTNFKFQGWADRFLTTPADGVRDLYGSAGWSWAAIGPAKAVTVQAIVHRFTADRAARRYGQEVDVIASARLGRTTASVRYADYAAKTFATDTTKLWLQLDWTI